MTELLSFQFMRYALLAGVIVSVMCGAISNFVVLKRLSFLTAFTAALFISSPWAGARAAAQQKPARDTSCRVGADDVLGLAECRPHGRRQGGAQQRQCGRGNHSASVHCMSP